MVAQVIAILNSHQPLCFNNAIIHTKVTRIVCYQENSWDEDLQYPVQVSMITGNVVHLQIWQGTLVKDVIRQCMYDDRLSCGIPMLECTPLTINLSIAKMQASGGKFRLATFDGGLLQDAKIIRTICHFRVVFMKQISQLP